MKKWLIIIIVFAFSIFLAACSNEEQSSDSADKAAESMEKNITEESGGSPTGTSNSVNEQEDRQSQEAAESKENEISNVNRKIIYTANLSIQVKDYQKAVNDIQTQVSDRGGYVVESNMYGDSEKGSTNGQMTIRIPQDQFREFIQLVEEGSSEVLESSISGQDVTEEYIDLESRLKSKHVVENRLLSFMEQAEKTEDLLAISEDLAKVQGEIEQITGRMKYLQNKADLATVTIQIQENNVTISGINEDDLNTWEKTKQQFLKSINFLISTFSGLFVFLFGNLPILLVLGCIGLITFLIVKKSTKNKRRD
ncbi:DUF4349 domain-containing protein [Virgibacillus necropolis]|uniref:DUF4349 domain-containing protein n=1 Tax=Virgibacillus necropolis TaxID=163877 RepID=UPI00137472B4|nr:DUF4349 domain-containing protein [Virgibacillus necropolis]